MLWGSKLVNGFDGGGPETPSDAIGIPIDSGLFELNMCVCVKRFYVAIVITNIRISF